LFKGGFVAVREFYNGAKPGTAAMNRLYYAHDPMCSWCWGFAPVLRKLSNALPEGLPMTRLLGGLAPDTDKPMPLELQKRLAQFWRTIQARIPGTEFNFDFWTQCQPRRSTYPSCRAVIAARLQGREFDHLMTTAIQRAYYLQARNPSDEDVLIDLAQELGLDREIFAQQLVSVAVDQEFTRERIRCRELGLNSYPSLLLETGDERHHIRIDYRDHNAMLMEIRRAGRSF
jgi:putative protein-disulfide isomerase